MELRGRHRLVETRADDEVADVGVGFQQHGRREQHVVDPDDAVFVELDVVDERRTAMQCEIQCIVQVVIQVCTGRDDEVHEAPVHHLDDRAAEAGRRHGTGDGQPDRGLVLGRQHLLGENLAGFRQAPGIERLEAVVDQVANLGAALRAIVRDRLAGQ